MRNGSTSYFWFDNWLGTGRIIDKTGDLGPTYLGIPRQALVSDACSEEGWKLRSRGRRVFGAVYEEIEGAEKPIPGAGQDVPLSKHDADDYKDHFSTSRTWDQIRVRGQEVSWCNLVWFPQRIPRQAFIVWLAFKDRLSTGVRMRQWGITQACVLCGERDESRDHLFFACPFTFTIWSTLTANLLGSTASPDWSITVTSLRRKRRNKLDEILLKMVFHNTVSTTWQERNSRRHQGAWLTTDTLIRRIDKAIRNRICSLKYTGTHKLEGLLRRWFEVYTR